jgi:hypothetical protein
MLTRLLIATLSFTTNVCLAQQQQALIIGIDKYTVDGKTCDCGGRKVRDLYGCKNDARSIASLITTKFGFKEKNIKRLFDEEASRANIIASLDSICSVSKNNDIVFFYFAGHGSQQYNSKSNEADTLDETIVPADVRKENIGDIRDKEQAKIFNRFINKGVKLTVILDCCHSSSMSRGPVYDTLPTRYLPKNKSDAKDSSHPAAPEKNGNNFLMISAAQDFEVSKEQRDENNQVHGAFTLALLHALQQQSVNATVEHIFMGTRAILKSYGKTQEPALAGSDARMDETLFGIKEGLLPDKFLIAFAGIENKVIKLQGGFAEGLQKGNELTNKDVVVRINNVTGISSSEATVLRGDINKIKVGELFEVTNWVASTGPLLKVYIPPTNFKYADILKLSKLALEVKKSSAKNWVTDLENNYYNTFYFKGDKLFVNKGDKIEEIKNVQLQNIVQAANKKPLFFKLPASAELDSAIRKKFINKAVSIGNNADEADYILYGTISANGKPSYGLLKYGLGVKNSSDIMPLQTQTFDLLRNDKQAYEQVAANIYEYAAKLAKIRGWLTLKAPAGVKFPFHLQFEDVKTKSWLEKPIFKLKEKISAYIVPDKGSLPLKTDSLHIYVFSISKTGDMTLCYPHEGEGSGENRFPKEYVDMKKGVWLFTFDEGQDIETYDYFLLATADALSNPGILNQKGVKQQNDKRGGGSPLEELINIGNEDYNTRGGPVVTPANWTLLRTEVTTVK